MATRYLQLQHDNKQGKQSGDGRSIWNGYFKGNGKTWDISSCGTGATALSPAASKLGRNIKTGDKEVSYGCGYADFYDGIAGGMMSEIFHQNGIPTERTLAVIRYEGGLSVNVRVAENLVRPAHMFRYLKLGDHQNLKALCDYFIKTEVKNGNKDLSDGRNKYHSLEKYLSQTFAKSAALYERRYIFCWFEWDGDNILAKDAAILDYGSVRQFGLFHKEYRYDDVERWSTNLLEQKTKARYIIQTTAQMIDFVISGELKPLNEFSGSESVKAYDEYFSYYKKYFLLEQCGLSEADIVYALKKHKANVAQLEASFEYFERLQSNEGIKEVPDGISSDAVFCMKDLLREIPKEYMANFNDLSLEQMVNIMKSSYANDEDLSPKSHWYSKAKTLQSEYKFLVKKCAKRKNKTENQQLLEMCMRSSLMNRFDQITGNGILEVTGYLMKKYPFKKTSEIDDVAKDFIQQQSNLSHLVKKGRSEKSKTIRKMLKLVEENREEI